MSIYFTTQLSHTFKDPKSSGVLVGPLGEGQHDVSAAHHGGMGDKSVIGPTLALFGKIEKRLGHLEEHLDVPSAPIGHDNLLVAQGGVGGQQGQPLFGAPVPDEHDLCRHRDALVVFSDLDHDRGENLCAASSLADLPVDGRQMEIFPLVAIEDLFRDLEHAEGMHSLGKQVPHDCWIGKPAVEQKMLGLDPACKGLGHHLHKDIGCLADAFPATPRPVGTAVKVRTQRDQPVLFLAGGKQRTGNGQKADTVGPPQGEQNPEHGDRRNTLLLANVVLRFSRLPIF